MTSGFSVKSSFLILIVLMSCVIGSCSESSRHVVSVQAASINAEDGRLDVDLIQRIALKGLALHGIDVLKARQMEMRPVELIIRNLHTNKFFMLWMVQKTDDEVAFYVDIDFSRRFDGCCSQGG